MANKRKQLGIAVDPGFDSFKIIIEGHSLKFPFNVEKTDENDFNNMNIDSSFILYRNEANETYRVGKYARDLIYENKSQSNIEDKMKEFYSANRLVSKEFEVGMLTAIGKSLYEYSQLDNDFDLNNISNYDIYLGVALPHSQVDGYKKDVISKLSGTHKFKLTIGNLAPIDFNIILDEHRIIPMSQTIAAIFNETSTSTGALDMDKNYFFTDGPTLVIDGGYYTVGLVTVSKGGTIDSKKCESDVEHAMKNVNIKVADELKDIRPDAKHYTIEYLISENNGKLRYIKNNEDGTKEGAVFDVAETKEKKINETCTEFIDYLNQKYNYLLDVNYVLVTGGTGNEYFNQLKEYYVGKNFVDSDKFILSNVKLNGKDLSVEYGIVAGSYKVVRYQIKLTTSDEEI